MEDYGSIDAELPINRGNAETASTAALPNGSHRSDDCVLERTVSRDVVDGACLPTASVTASNATASNATTSNAIASKQQLSSESLQSRPPTRGHTPFWKACQSVFMGWWIEFVSFLVLCLSLVAIFITLYLHEDQPLPRWHLGITVNTLVAIYVVVLKAAIILITTQGMFPDWPHFHYTRS